MATQEGQRRRVNHIYDIPSVRIRTPRHPLWITLFGFVCVIFAIRHVWLVAAFGHHQLLTSIWLGYFIVTAAQWALSWLERPFEVKDMAQCLPDSLTVTVCIPVYNEDPEVLDRVLYSLFQQTRLPTKVQVVDDGSKVDYTEVREWWSSHHPSSVQFLWSRQENRGKKFAHYRCFSTDQADVVVTLDSDTVLESRAIAEGIKPFSDSRVQSVAGFELAWNHDRNLLTRINSTRQLVWQLVTCSAQNVAGGNVLINRGTFALYRGTLVRDVLEGYVGEVFWGHPIKLGDDTYLTTLALCRGRAVQQPSAVCLTMYPETFSHHIRQWTRWMRGTTLRTFWRIRYLKPTSWGWVYTVLSLWLFVGSLAVTAVLLALWPKSGTYIQAFLAVTIVWAWALGTRLLVVDRSDQDRAGEVGAALLSPASSLWVLLVLRFVRIYGTFTFLRQGWTTRSEVEIRANSIDGSGPPDES